MSKAERALILTMRDPAYLTALAQDVRAGMTAAGWLADGKLTASARRFYADHIEPDLRFARRPAFMRRKAR